MKVLQGEIYIQEAVLNMTTSFLKIHKFAMLLAPTQFAQVCRQLWLCQSSEKEVENVLLITWVSLVCVEIPPYLPVHRE